jgi:hypothetical protein
MAKINKKISIINKLVENVKPNDIKSLNRVAYGLLNEGVTFKRGQKVTTWGSEGDTPYPFFTSGTIVEEANFGFYKVRYENGTIAEYPASILVAL